MDENQTEREISDGWGFPVTVTAMLENIASSITNDKKHYLIRMR